MTQVLVSEALGHGLDLAAAMNDRTRRAMLNRVVADYKLGDRTIMAAVDQLDLDLRAEIKKAMDAAGTLDTGLQKTQLEKIISDLMKQPAFVQGLGGKNAMIGGELKTLASVFDAQFFRQPRPASEEYVYASSADVIPSGSVAKLVDGSQAVFSAVTRTIDTNEDGKDDRCVVKFETANYGGFPASWEWGMDMLADEFLGEQTTTYRTAFVSRVTFDLSVFFVSGVDVPVTSLDLNADGTTDGTAPATGA